MNRLKALLQRRNPGATEEGLLGRISAAMALVAARTTGPSADVGGNFLKQRKAVGPAAMRGRRCCCCRLFEHGDCPHDRVSQNRCPAISTGPWPARNYLKP